MLPSHHQLLYIVMIATFWVIRHCIVRDKANNSITKAKIMQRNYGEISFSGYINDNQLSIDVQFNVFSSTATVSPLESVMTS